MPLVMVPNTFNKTGAVPLCARWPCKHQNGLLPSALSSGGVIEDCYLQVTAEAHCLVRHNVCALCVVSRGLGWVYVDHLKKAFREHGGSFPAPPMHISPRSSRRLTFRSRVHLKRRPPSLSVITVKFDDELDVEVWVWSVPGTRRDAQTVMVSEQGREGALVPFWSP